MCALGLPMRCMLWHLSDSVSCFVGANSVSPDDGGKGWAGVFFEPCLGELPRNNPRRHLRGMLWCHDVGFCL
jgi:hypothetical protein